MGPGSTVGQALVEGPLINVVSFTGSVPVGGEFAKAVVGNFTKIQLETG